MSTDLIIFEVNSATAWKIELAHIWGCKQVHEPFLGTHEQLGAGQRAASERKLQPGQDSNSSLPLDMSAPSVEKQDL